MFEKIENADRRKVVEHYNALGMEEWSRLGKDLPSRVSFEVHKNFLSQFVQPGMRVLEVGAGPGRFTIELAKMNCHVVVTDISPIQIELNQEVVTKAGYASSVERWDVLDICNPQRFMNSSFDAIVVYGGVLSYVFENLDDVLRNLLQMIKPEGVIIGSVMSRWGTWKHSLLGVAEFTKKYGEEANDAVLKTGDLRPYNTDHPCVMFTSQEFINTVNLNGGRIISGSASNWASLGNLSVLAEIESSPNSWSHFLRHEIEACQTPGLWDGAPHFLFAIKQDDA